MFFNVTPCKWLTCNSISARNSCVEQSQTLESHSFQKGLWFASIKARGKSRRKSRKKTFDVKFSFFCYRVFSDLLFKKQSLFLQRNERKVRFFSFVYYYYYTHVYIIYLRQFSCHHTFSSPLCLREKNMVFYRIDKKSSDNICKVFWLRIPFERDLFMILVVTIHFPCQLQQLILSGESRRKLIFSLFIAVGFKEVFFNLRATGIINTAPWRWYCFSQRRQECLFDAAMYHYYWHTHAILGLDAVHMHQGVAEIAKVRRPLYQRQSHAIIFKNNCTLYGSIIALKTSPFGLPLRVWPKVDTGPLFGPLSQTPIVGSHEMPPWLVHTRYLVCVFFALLFNCTKKHTQCIFDHSPDMGHLL